MDVNVLFQKMNSMAKNVASRGAYMYVSPDSKNCARGCGKSPDAMDVCANGLDMKQLQYILGHKTPGIVLKVYVHMRPNQPEKLSHLWKMLLAF